MDSMKKDGNEVVFCAEDVERALGSADFAATDEKDMLIIGPWDEPYTAYQRALYGAMEWLARARVAYEPEALFEVEMFGGVIRVRDNGDVVVHIGPLASAMQRAFEWLWDKGLP